MSSAKLTLIGLQKYMIDFEDDLFKNLVLPEGIDKEILTNNILLNGGEFEVMYSDPYFLQLAIQLWGKKWYRTFQKWVTVLSIEYAPLENYDRMENWTDTTDRNISTSASRDNDNTRTFNNTDKRTDDLTTTSEEQVSAFDSSSYQPSKKTTIEEDGTDTMDHTGTITDEYGETSSGSEEEDKEDVHTGRIHGNIGVTTSQQMLQAELDISLWNIYEHITDLFLSEFIIPIYT